MPALHSPCSEPYCVSWQATILRELARYFGGHWKLLASPQWKGFTLFPFAADTQTWKLLNLPFWIILDTRGQTDCLRKCLICWVFFCIRHHNEYISEVPPAEPPAAVIYPVPWGQLGVHSCLQLVCSHLCRWLLGSFWTIRELSRHPSTALSSSYATITKELTNSITFAPEGKLFSFFIIKHITHLS